SFARRLAASGQNCPPFSGREALEGPSKRRRVAPPFARLGWPSAGSPRDDLVRLGLRDGLGAYLSEQRVGGKVRVLNPLARLPLVSLHAIDAGVPDLTTDAERIIDRPRVKDQSIVSRRHFISERIMHPEAMPRP